MENKKSTKKYLLWTVAAILLLGFYLGYSDGRKDSQNKVESTLEVKK